MMNSKPISHKVVKMALFVAVSLFGTANSISSEHNSQGKQVNTAHLQEIHLAGMHSQENHKCPLEQANDILPDHHKLSNAEKMRVDKELQALLNNSDPELVLAARILLQVDEPDK